MDHSYIKQTLEEHPAIKILRARNAPLILGFLYEAFKKRQVITISNQDLVIALAQYLNTLEEEQPEDLFDRSRGLIEDWCSEKNRYIRKYLNNKGEAVHELTSYTERTFRWLEDLKPRKFIGTESRFNNILNRLEELVEKTTDDPVEKIKDLKKKKADLSREIKEIEASRQVKVFSRLQIRERFEEISRNARDLIADFKEMENNFKQIVEQIFKEEMDRKTGRGEILGFTLDANDELKESPQGKTFHSFWNFLIADAGDDKINTLVEKVYDILLEKDLSRKDNFLRNLKYYLHQAGKRIIDSNHILAEKLNRMLSESSFIQRKRIKELIGEIKKDVFDLKENPPEENAFMETETTADINIVMDRPLVMPEKEPDFRKIPRGELNIEKADLSPLFEQFYIDKGLLEKRIKIMLKEKEMVSLKEVLHRFPPKKGLSEILTYFEIASASKKATIFDDKKCCIHYDINKTTKTLNSPEVIYHR